MAELAYGHCQHVPHQPQLVSREWVTKNEG
ncbi:MAG: DUF3565 domain-containing protein [Planctomycetota bacterium]|nr:DUF3565 domain-containing protein [Planctomycetota bacterium]